MYIYIHGIHKEKIVKISIKDEKFKFSENLLAKIV